MFGGKALGIHGVAAFVERGEEGVAEEFLVVPRGDARVAGGDAGGEGMQRNIETASLEVEANLFGGETGEFLLGGFGVELFEDMKRCLLRRLRNAGDEID